MRRPEAVLQRQVIGFLWFSLPKSVFWTAINAAPPKGERMGAIAKSLGQKPGVPDILLIWEGRAYWIELKAKGGQVSEAQRITLIDLTQAGSFTAVCRSLDEVVGTLAGWGLPMQARAA